MSTSTDSTAASGLKLAPSQSLYFAIFAISGFSGLIYESIWSHYLKLFLGHAAYAQSLVLIIFMGGMAAGSWIASRLSNRSRIPILWYAAIEAVVGIAALLFHGVFTGLIDVFYSALLPSLGTPVLGTTLKWLACSLLIMPQSILLGMTFPLMSAYIIRRFPDTPGGSIAMLYFTNSIGASIGVLASGFWLIKAVGLPGTILTAGLLNIALAIVVWVLVRLDPRPETEPLAQTESTPARHTLRTLFLVAAFITGAASFIYEISWIRMLSLVLGATTHAFELMLSAFIAGLAFGGLWIKRRIDRISDPVRFSGLVQLIMGIFALLTIPVYLSSYDWMSWLMAALDRNPAAYSAFSISSHVIALGVMLPTTFMAGMTLPLFTYVLIQKGDGEASIGRIYAANTIGAIAGVLFAVHVGLPFLGLKNLIIFGALLDIVLAIVLLRHAVALAPSNRHPLSVPAGVIVGLGAVVLTFVATDIEKQLLISGVYRHGNTDTAMGHELLYYRDGKTASVSLRQTPDDLIILATNGKVDASIQMNPEAPASIDEITMTLAGTIPLAYKPDAKRIANIGMGSGQTTHVLLGYPGLEVVDTIEIEAAMIEAAMGFGPHVARAYEDPRSRIHVEDAKTFFSLHNSVYDIIIAEPSNPWVSGVSSLFSTEFYATIKNHLEPDGIFVQWIQLYEFSDALSESILKALAENFGDFAIYATDSADVLFIARNEGRLDAPFYEMLWEGDLGEALENVNVNSPADIRNRRIADRAMLSTYLDLVSSPTNSDYYPYVDLNAGRARFIGQSVASFDDWMNAPLPMLEMLHGELVEFGAVETSNPLNRNQGIMVARSVYQEFIADSVTEAPPDQGRLAGNLRYLSDWLLLSEIDCTLDNSPERWHTTVFNILVTALHFLDPAPAQALVDRIYSAPCETARSLDAEQWRSLYSAVAMRDGATMARSARRILDRNMGLDVARDDYLLAAAMLGEIASGRAGHAHEAWESFGAERFRGKDVPYHLRLLLSIAVGAVS